MLFGIFTLQAQSISVKGTVYDENKQPLPGTSIIVKGTTKGTTTDMKGQYEITADKGNTLIFTFIGYDNQEITVNQNTSKLDVQMKSSANAIEEVVVSVGYGQMAKKDISGAVTSIKTEDLEKGVVSANLSDALSGRMAGVQVTSSQGGPGAGVDITIRGGNSLTGSNAPLWVIDGFPVDNPNTFSVDPKDIAQMQVLKDASATAIYGARGANGVIIIETKKGKDDGKVSVEYNGTVSVSTFPSERKIKMLSGLDYLHVAKSVSEGKNTFIFHDKYLVNDQYKWTAGANGEHIYTLDKDGQKIPLTWSNADDHEKLSIEDYANMPWTMYDWQDEAFKTAITHSHRVAVSGGNKTTKYNISTSVFQQDGMLLHTGIDKYNFRVSLDQKLSKKMRFTGLVNYNATRRHGLQTAEGNRNSVLRDILQYAPVNPAMYGPMGVDGIPADFADDAAAEAADAATNMVYHPIRNINNAYREAYYDQLTANGTLNYQIHKNLKMMIRGGYTHYAFRQEIFNNSQSRYGNPAISPDGRNAEIQRTVRDSWFNEYTLTYAKTWDRHRFDVMGGYTMEGFLERNNRTRYTNIPNDIFGMDNLTQAGGVSMPSQGIFETFAMSFLGRVNYVYSDKYIFTASFRADGSSKFLGDNQFGYFPSAAVAWRASQENFLRDVAWLSNLKLRASWGLTGNNRIGGNSAYGAIGSSNDTGYIFDSEYIYGYLPSRLTNNSLKWETTRQVDLGIDFSVFRNRIQLTVDWYHKKTKDLLLNADLTPSSGYRSAYKNIGKVQNTGWEISLNTTNIDHKDFKWYTSFNVSFNRNKVLGLNSGQDHMLTDPQWFWKYNQSQYIAQIGQPASMIYGYIYDGVYQNDDFIDDGHGNMVVKPGLAQKVNSKDAEPGLPKYRDLNGNGIIDQGDRTVIGNPNPKAYGGFTNNFEWKNFDLSIFFTWVAGNDILNANEAMLTNFENPKNNFLASTLNHWTPDNPTNLIPKPYKGDDYNVSSRSIENGSYLRLQNISLGYTLNTKNLPFLRKIGLSSVHVYFSADNLYVWTDYSGYDPEVNTKNSALTRGLDYCSYPRSRNFTFGLDLKF